MGLLESTVKNALENAKLNTMFLYSLNCGIKCDGHGWLFFDHESFGSEITTAKRITNIKTKSNPTGSPFTIPLSKTIKTNTKLHSPNRPHHNQMYHSSTNSNSKGNSSTTTSTFTGTTNNNITATATTTASSTNYNISNNGNCCNSYLFERLTAVTIDTITP